MRDEQNVPKWGDPIEHIPEERRAMLRALADQTRADDQLAFAGEKLTGAEVYFLVLYALAGSAGDFAEAERALASGLSSGIPAFYLCGANLKYAQLQHAELGRVDLESAILFEAHLEGANLEGAHLERANLVAAHLEGANLWDAHLEQADLGEAHLEGANLMGAHLAGADLSEAFFSTATNLSGAIIASAGETIQVADVQWQGVNLARIEWPKNLILDDEPKHHPQPWEWSFWLGRDKAHGPIVSNPEERQKVEEWRQKERRQVWSAPMRANRQLAVAMREQGMHEEADHFAYRGQLCQRALYWVQGSRGRWFGSLLLDLTSGYGYRPGRSAVAYLVVIMVFAGLYLLNGQFAAPHLRWDEALVLSISSFHGRGFFTSGISLGDTLARLAAGEAIIGLLLEVTFISTFTNRFFSR